MKLEHSSSRTSDFELNQLAWSHHGKAKKKAGWKVRPKTDGMMQSAGGLVTSVNDMGRWLQAQLERRDSKRNWAHPKQSWTKLTNQLWRSMVDLLMNCLPLVMHLVGTLSTSKVTRYTCMVEGTLGPGRVMAFCPELNIGIGVFSNSDNMTGWLTHRTACYVPPVFDRSSNC